MKFSEHIAKTGSASEGQRKVSTEEQRRLDEYERKELERKSGRATWSRR